MQSTQLLKEYQISILITTKLQKNGRRRNYGYYKKYNNDMTQEEKNCCVKRHLCKAAVWY